MKQMISTRWVALAVVTTMMAATLPALAQDPYWDSSSSGGSYYAPSQGQGAAPSQYGQSQQQYHYNQPQSQYGQSQYGQQHNQQPAYNQGNTQLRGYVSTAPAGTPLTTRTTTYLSSETALIGDPVNVSLAYDLAMGGSVILPAGSQIQGQVVSAIPAKRTGRHGQLQLRFNRAVLPDGRQVPLSARLVTEDGTGILKGGTRSDRAKSAAKNTIGGAALGAGLGALLGAARGGGRADDYLARGAVVGAAGGLGRTAYKRGRPAELRPGTDLQLMLDQPLTVQNAGAGSGYGPSNHGGGYAPY